VELKFFLSAIFEDAVYLKKISPMNSLQATSLFYVDDDPDDLEFFQEAVNAIGESVVLFSLADDMINAIKNPPPAPSIIFLDLNMPNKSGFEVIQEIKRSEAYKGLPLVVYSTASHDATVERCREMGANLYIRKPTSLTELKEAIKYVAGVDWKKLPPTDFLYKG
jgi:CheY-like chemotaxis protein